MLSTQTILLALLSISVSVNAAPIRREVPQEHSHEPFITSVRASLALNNPDGIVDPVFALLGDAAAAQGLGKIADVECLQQATADQAFTNAKAAGDVAGQVDALIFRALERNTGKVGQASNACTSIKAVNPEIAAIQQHQDPASTGAAAANKAVVLALAQQIAAVGGNPQDALKSGTFAPGNLDDNTGAGNTCDDANDANGCIFTQNLLVDDATAAEIDAAVSGVAAAATTAAAADASAATATDASAAAATDSSAAAATDASAAAATDASAAATVADSAAAATATAKAGKHSKNKGAKAASVAAAATVAATDAAASTDVAAAAAATATVAAAAAATPAAAAGANLQTFTGALGGAPPPVVAGGKGFEVDGSEFLNLSAAIGRSCDVQHNACANAANSGATAGLTASQCDAQDTACKATAA